MSNRILGLRLIDRGMLPSSLSVEKTCSQEHCDTCHIINEFVIILTERPEPDRREPEGGDPDRGEPIISIAYLNDASPVRNTRVERSDHAIGADRSYRTLG